MTINLLVVLLGIKIIVTAIAVCLPFLAFSQQILSSSLQISTQSALLFRLYGVAILALLVCYSFGLQQALLGEFPWAIVATGVVSNGGASVLLISLGHAKQLRIVGLFFGIIALLLLLCALQPTLALAAI